MPDAKSTEVWTPRVSVIVPTYNSEGTITDALESIANQNYPELEVLVIDDGSTDSTVQRVRQIYPGAVLHAQRNSGAAVARNRGLKSATGEVMAFLDADDVWFPGKLRAQVNCLAANPSAGFVYHTWLVDALPPVHEELARRAAAENWPSAEVIIANRSGWLYTTLLHEVVIHTSTLMLRRDLAAKTGYFNESLRRGQDFEYWLRMSRIAPGIKLARPFSLYRQHSGNSIRVPQNRNYAFEIISRAIHEWGNVGPDGLAIDPKLLRQVLSRSYRDFAYLHADCGNPGVAFRAALRAMAQDPGSLTNVLQSMRIAARALIGLVSHQRT